MEQNELITQIEKADMVLVGLGEDFDNQTHLKQHKKYIDGCEKLKELNMQSLLPSWAVYCTQKDNDTYVQDALSKLKGLLVNKNYFVISVSTNPLISKIEWKNDRIVMPCGSSDLKQCVNGCGDVIPLELADKNSLELFFEKLYLDSDNVDMSTILGTCSECGHPFVLNNIYVDSYNENGYLEQWSIYMKWLQGTVNRNLLILELGVGLKYPSVIRWPFEKVAFYNQKSFFYRVHERLYQLPAELTAKGYGISKNAIEWLSGL